MFDRAFSIFVSLVLPSSPTPPKVWLSYYINTECDYLFTSITANKIEKSTFPTEKSHLTNPFGDRKKCKPFKRLICGRKKWVPNHSSALVSSSKRWVPQATFIMMGGSQSLTAGLNLSEIIIVLKSKYAKCKTKSWNKNTFVFSSGCLRQLKPVRKEEGGVMSNEHRGSAVHFSIRLRLIHPAKHVWPHLWINVERYNTHLNVLNTLWK